MSDGELALDDGTRRRSRAELADRVTRWARLLRESLRVAPGEHAALLIGNRVEAVEGVLAAIHAGVWMTPINWHLTEAEIAYVLGDCGARVLFTARGSRPPSRSRRRGAGLDAALAGARDEPMPEDGPAGGNMIYTSGTTGRPKGVQRRVAATLAAARDAQRAYARSIACDGSGPHLVTGPLYHAAPVMYAIYDSACGAPILVLPRWDEREALRWIREREVHHTHLVPTMFVRLLARLPEEERAAFRAPALHSVLHGAAPIAPEVKRRVLAWWGPILYEYWAPRAASPPSSCWTALQPVAA